MNTLKSRVLAKKQGITEALQSVTPAAASMFSWQKGWDKGWNKDGH